MVFQLRCREFAGIIVRLWMSPAVKAYIDLFETIPHRVDDIRRPIVAVLVVVAVAVRSDTVV